MHSRYIAVVGGVNLDISGTPAAPMIAGDSNPGEVQVTYGGVGRNIAENIARLGQSVKMITALGDDGYTTPLRAFCESSGIDMSYSGVILGMRNSTYLCINDEHGDVLYAIADMAICDRITPEFLEGRRSVLEKASLIVADANLSPETLVWLCESFDVPVMADPVSVTKSTRLLKALPHLYCVKPNRPEAEALSGIAIREDADLETAAAVLLEKGCRQVFISLGARGVYFDDGKIRGIQPCLVRDVVNTNGCGDAFFAAAALGFLEGMSIAESARLGQAASAICAMSNAAVSPDLNRERLFHRYQEA